jgi:hypothetical protein
VSQEPLFGPPPLVVIDAARSYTRRRALGPGLMKRRLLALVALTPALAGGRFVLASPPPPLLAPPISGVVRSVETPISGALVILYNLADTSLTRARTGTDGTFVVAAAPVGIYDLIAYKKGFVPALVRLWHQAAPQQVSSISIELASSGKGATARGASAPDIWELRDRLPADVLREITAGDTGERAPASPVENAQRRFTRFDGNVQTVTDVARTDTSLARAAVGVRGGLPNGWAYALAGDYASVSDPHNAPPSEGTTLGSAAGLALDVAPSALDHVRLTTRRNQLNFGDQGPGSLQAHQVTWDRGGGQGSAESVAARYVDEAGVYSATAPGTALFPSASRTLELEGAYGRPATDSPGISVAMTYRRREAGPSGAQAQVAPDADLTAGASMRLGAARLEGGVVARYLSGGYGLAPRAEARLELSDGSVLFMKGLYRVVETGAPSGTFVMPRVASVQDSNDPASRLSVAAGLQHRRSGGSYTIQVSEQQLDEAVRAFFDGDMLTEFDSVYLMGGNTVRRVDGAAQHRLTNALAGTITAGYGTIDGSVRPDETAAYGILDNRGRFWTAQAGVEVLPTKTGVAVVVHGVRQQLATLSSSLRNDSDKLALTLAQDLSVVGFTPFGMVCRLIVALESTRSTNLSEKEDARINKRLLGGVAVAF